MQKFKSPMEHLPTASGRVRVHSHGMRMLKSCNIPGTVNIEPVLDKA